MELNFSKKKNVSWSALKYRHNLGPARGIYCVVVNCMEFHENMCSIYHWHESECGNYSGIYESIGFIIDTLINHTFIIVKDGSLFMWRGRKIVLAIEEGHILWDIATSHVLQMNIFVQTIESNCNISTCEVQLHRLKHNIRALYYVLAIYLNTT